MVFDEDVNAVDAADHDNFILKRTSTSQSDTITNSGSLSYSLLITTLDPPNGNGVSGGGSGSLT